MICERCGETINEGIKFCTKCGAKISDISPGKNILMITGILFIIFAVFGILGAVSSAVLLSDISSLNLGTGIPGGTFGIILLFIINIINSILNTVIGISGFKYNKDNDKAKLLIFFAVIFIAFQIVSLVITYSITRIFSLWVSFLGFILPIMFLIGAFMNLKAKGED